jgi:organic hydroperoxide reductase OsmC/OhrA
MVGCGPDWHCKIQFRSQCYPFHFSARFGGVDGRWTPQDLLLCAVASCYTTTFRAVAEIRSLNTPTCRWKWKAPSARPTRATALARLHSPESDNLAEHAQEQARALMLLQRAEALCMVSHALAVKQRFEPRVQVGEAHSGEAGQLCRFLATSISDEAGTRTAVGFAGACSMIWPSPGR